MPEPDVAKCSLQQLSAFDSISVGFAGVSLLSPRVQIECPFERARGDPAPCSWVCMTPDPAHLGQASEAPACRTQEGRDPDTPGSQEGGGSPSPGQADAKTLPRSCGSPRGAFGLTVPASVSSCPVYRPVGPRRPGDSPLNEGPLHPPKTCSSLRPQSPKPPRPETAVWFMQSRLAQSAMHVRACVYGCVCVCPCCLYALHCATCANVRQCVCKWAACTCVCEDTCAHGCIHVHLCCLCVLCAGTVQVCALPGCARVCTCACTHVGMQVSVHAHTD